MTVAFRHLILPRSQVSPGNALIRAVSLPSVTPSESPSADPKIRSAPTVPVAPSAKLAIEKIAVILSKGEPTGSLSSKGLPRAEVEGPTLSQGKTSTFLKIAPVSNGTLVLVAPAKDLPFARALLGEQLLPLSRRDIRK